MDRKLIALVVPSLMILSIIIGCKKDNPTPLQILTSHTWHVKSYSQGNYVVNSGCSVEQYFTFSTNGTGVEFDQCPVDTQATFNYFLSADNKTIFWYYPGSNAHDTAAIEQLNNQTLEILYKGYWEDYIFYAK